MYITDVCNSNLVFHLPTTHNSVLFVKNSEFAKETHRLDAIYTDSFLAKTYDEAFSALALDEAMANSMVEDFKNTYSNVMSRFSGSVITGLEPDFILHKHIARITYACSGNVSHPSFPIFRLISLVFGNVISKEEARQSIVESIAFMGIFLNINRIPATVVH